jgi:hypothetical protein
VIDSKPAGAWDRSPRIRAMRGALVAGVVIVVALAGCGGKSDEQQVRDTAKEFVDAVHSGNGKKACSLLTDASKPVYAQLGDIPCSQGVLRASLPRGLKVTRVRLTTGRATVGMRGPQGELRTLVLRHVADGWRVDVTTG